MGHAIEEEELRWEKGHSGGITWMETIAQEVVFEYDKDVATAKAVGAML